MRKLYKVRYGCGHDGDIWIDGGPHKIAAEKNNALYLDCCRCQRSSEIDLTSPAGAQMATVKAVESGWSDDEITVGVRFGNDDTFICPGCKRRYPQSLAMAANLATTCPDCYDDYS